MQWWAERSERERMLILSMGIVIGALGLFQFGYKPLMAFRASSERALDDARILHDEVRNGTARIRAMRADGFDESAGSEGPLRTTVTISAHKAKLVITRLEPEAEGGLNVWLDAVRAPDLQRWLAALYEDDGIRVVKASIRKHDEGDSVRAQILFKRGG